jgi:hypothetical protein
MEETEGTEGKGTKHFDGMKRNLWDRSLTGICGKLIRYITSHRNVKGNERKKQINIKTCIETY